MGRELRRVPMDFDYPLNYIWQGFLIQESLSTCVAQDKRYCNECRKFAEIKGIPLDAEGCPCFGDYLAEPIKKIKELLAPPAGEGYQLWENTSEGSPMSPVFSTLEDLCAWCEENATVFADSKTSKEQWMKKLSGRDAQHA